MINFGHLEKGAVGDVVRRLKGLAIFFGGLVLTVLGIGMWRSPEINWGSFLVEWSILTGEMNRLIHDPFAILGILVLIVGIYIAIYGIKRTVKG
ncbi:hypothetical protein ACFLVU_02495 [Chloroflexota bacterium]